MSTQSKVNRVIELTKKIVPGSDQMIQEAIKDMSRGSANGAQKLIRETKKAMQGKENTPEGKELVRIGQELAQAK